MPFLLRRIRNTISRTSLRKPVLWYRSRQWTDRDAFACEYPKSGITWLRFLLYEVLTGKPADWVDVNRVVIDRSFAAPVFPGGGRMIPTHEPYRREYGKAIYLVRDARDVVLSEYAFQKALELFTGDLDAFIVAFLRGRVNGFGAWHRHVASWLDASDAGRVNLLLVKYEDMRGDPEGKLAEIVKFLGVERSAAAIRAAVENNSLEKMRVKEDAARRLGKGPLRKMERGSAGNRFVREGKVAGWRERLTGDQVGLIERHTGSMLERLGYARACVDDSGGG